MPLTRRAFLRAFSAAAVLAPAAPALAGCAGTEDVPAVPFGARLPIPPLDRGTVETSGGIPVRTFRLAPQAGTHEYVPGKAAESMGYNGALLGPTLRAARGEKVRVSIENRLAEATTVHFHGMMLPAAADGGPHAMIDPGGSAAPEWTIDQPAATLWYHPHPHGSTEKQVGLGLAGLFLLDEAQDGPGASLPHEYGVDDIPLIVQDRRLDGSGKVAFDPSGNSLGTLGNSIAANGTLGAVLPATTQRVRLRILNASAGRWFKFGFADHRRFHMVASDGGLLAAPLELDAVQLSPAERAEIVVELRPGESVMLRSFAPDLGRVSPPDAFGGGRDFDVVRLDAAASLAPSSPLPAAFGALPEPVDARTATSRSFTFSGRQINGRTMDMERIDFTAAPGAPEVWFVDNVNPYQHNVHVHGVQFRLLDINGAPPPPERAGWKDTIPLLPRERNRIAFRMPRYADAEHPYMYHCHLLTHEDQGMMGQFTVAS
ncbi:FtsP/CotA-like multicopper oxidase with cupredoxin domain [Sinomonas atrocyanea]|uniref:multicopper oxidase family protein n=1 Tax=Sinomonas atrocyanea TaxID=37927 RepID=UPI00277D6606|nr:multicopper oxidase domain-containing protein [Sinomonas atrocyanea]MDQ0260201.1 FtsP/CotA-like multicopper oxidase with cupredoxin domain [Sinomonas atrocyanea]